MADYILTTRWTTRLGWVLFEHVPPWARALLGRADTNPTLHTTLTVLADLLDPYTPVVEVHAALWGLWQAERAQDPTLDPEGRWTWTLTDEPPPVL